VSKEEVIKKLMEYFKSELDYVVNYGNAILVDGVLNWEDLLFIAKVMKPYLESKNSL